jgi:hypothetical protein
MKKVILRTPMRTKSNSFSDALLHKNLHFYPYRVTAVQELNPADYPIT